MRGLVLTTVLVSIIGGLWGTEASANTLSAARARATIDREIGFVFEDYYRASETFGACTRRSVHVVSCPVTVAFQVKADTTTAGSCNGRIAAVLYHRTLRVRGRVTHRRGHVRTNYLYARNRTFKCSPPGAP